LEKFQNNPEHEQSIAKVSVVLNVLAGEKSIAQVCKDTGLKPLQYYKLEEKMVQAMMLAAKAPPTRGRARNPLAEATNLAEKTDALRLEHRRLQSLMRMSRKLLKSGTRKRRKYRPRKPRTADPKEPGNQTPSPRRPGRPPATVAAQG
jgi:hypothetical protein